MNKRTRINLALLTVIVILLLASAGIYEEQQQPILISNIDANSITKITVTRKDKPELRFKKQADDWYMLAPLQIRVNRTRINAMLKLLNSKSHKQLHVNEVKLARLELDAPVVTLKLNEYVFQFGNTDGIDKRRYVLFNSTIYMLDDLLYAQLLNTPGFFVDTRLVAAEKDIASITFPENTFKLANNVWQMEKPMGIKPGQIKQLAYSWKNTIAISVSNYQEPQQDFPVIITTSDGESLRFDVVATEPHLVLGRKDLGIQYHISSDEAKKLFLQHTLAPPLKNTSIDNPAPGAN